MFVTVSNTLLNLVYYDGKQGFVKLNVSVRYKMNDFKTVISLDMYAVLLFRTIKTTKQIERIPNILNYRYITSSNLNNNEDIYTSHFPKPSNVNHDNGLSSPVSLALSY